MAFKLDFNWLFGEVGTQILNSVKENKKLRNFGLLEKPTLPPAFSSYDETNYKIFVIGKSNAGKTSFINALCQNRRSHDSTTETSQNYEETLGIQIIKVYWPIKLTTSDKFHMLNLSFWDAGKSFTTKYEYILPSCLDQLNCFVFVFSWTDKASFLDVLSNIKQIYHSNSNKQHLPKLIIGTKFDQIVKCEIEQSMINELESLANTKVIRFNSFGCTFEQRCSIMNNLCELLWNSTH